MATAVHAEDALCAATWYKSWVLDREAAPEAKVSLSAVESTSRNFLIEDDWGGIARVDPTDGWLELTDETEGPEYEQHGATYQRIETILKPGDTVYVFRH